MTQDLLLLVYALAAVGVFSLRWTLRLAPALSELPLKTGLATAFLLLMALGAGVGLLPEALALPLTVVAGLYILGPLSLPALARAAGSGAALALSRLLYWSEGSRAALRRLLAQVALQRGEVARALELAGEGDLLIRAQAYALEERWREVLALSHPGTRGGAGDGADDNASLAQGARVWALSELGDLEAAEAELADMRGRWQRRGQGPIGYRSLTLAEARLHAAKGELEAAHRLLQDKPLPGVPPYLVLMILGRAADRAHRGEQAVALYRQAYALAPQGQRTVVARRLAA
ncbi:MAG: hypothetical protein M3498_16265, partial [Deinococcota bacterium]|nr:hypothetical protein [Deinococcota bacterium]